MTATVHDLHLSRRSLLIGATGAVAAALLPQSVRANGATAFRLIAAPARVTLVGGSHPDTDVWTYNGQVPGTEIRARQGDRLRVEVRNRLPQETTVHWHGIRLPNAMDGVPHVTQAPIAPGETFTYEFDLPDAGTYWYHPHHRSAEQVGRGLAGALIIEEREPIAVDRDLVWVLGDWRLRRDVSISDDFGSFHDVSHAGRLGNTVTVNGRVLEEVAVRAGERIRLRLINAANARIFSLDFQGHAPQVITIDGQPVAPHSPAGGRVILGPAMRVDVVMDMSGSPGERFSVIDGFYPSRAYRLVDLAYGPDRPVREHPLDTKLGLSPNPLTEPDLHGAERHTVSLGGGMMGRMSGAMVDGERLDPRALMHRGLAWAVNGVAATGHLHDPILTLRRGHSYVLDLRNETAWWHPMHLHGHVFRVLSRNGEPTRHREWQDTVLVAPRERVEIGFAADNPGDWMFHCHILEHQMGGMMALIRVA